MRASGVAARRNPPPPPPSQPRQPESATPAFTLQQVITMLDSRLTAVEKRGALNNTNAPFSNSENESNALVDVITKVNNIATYMTDVDVRFNMLIDEIDTLKNTILSLQTFTMDVNKKLVDERFALPAVTMASFENNAVYSTDKESTPASTIDEFVPPISSGEELDETVSSTVLSDPVEN